MALLAAQRASFLTGARRQARVAKASNGSKVTMSRDLWLPGSTPPAHLDGSMPADYGVSPRWARAAARHGAACELRSIGLRVLAGFDPLGLGADPVALRW